MVDQELALSPNLIAFGPFVLDPADRTLSKGGLPVHVRERELSILIYLAERPGTFVSRDELISAIWLNTKVSEANVRVQMAALKRILGNGHNQSDFVTFSPGHGYRFQVKSRDLCVTDSNTRPPDKLERPPSPSTRPVLRSHNLPIRLKPSFGREETLYRLVSTLPLQRLITIVGAGGIGKTTLALTAAESVIEAYADGVRFINLAGLSNPALVSSAMAGTLGLSGASIGTEADLIRFIANKHILFVLDNCEHVIETAAQLVQQLLTRTPNAHFLCTSREPLHIDGEWLLRLGSLSVPPPQMQLTAAEAIAYPSVRLFVERVRLTDSQFQLEDKDAKTVGELCRRLDGNPLAVELAAACVGLFGIQGLASQLANTFSMLTQGRRTALPRHQTLRATLDWSYDILSLAERRLLRRLSIFRGDFTLASARAVAGDAEATEDDFVEWLAELTAKSLLNVDTSRQPARYRLLFLTRDYAFGKLTESGELQSIATRHALHFLDLLQSADSAEKALNGLIWIDDLRFAFEWSFSSCGHVLIGMQLANESIEIGRRLSILNEYADILDRAIIHFDKDPDIDPKLGVCLHIERLSIYLHAHDPMSQSEALVRRAEVLACQVFNIDMDPAYRLQVYLSKYARAFGSGDGPTMTLITHDMHMLAVQCGLEASLHILLERTGAQAAHFSGHHSKAAQLANGILGYSKAQIEARPHLPGDRVNPHITMQIIRARTLWLTGYSIQASDAAQAAVECAIGSWDHVTCYALAFAVIPVALWRGDTVTAREGIAQLAAKAADSAMEYWLRWSQAFTTALTMRNGYPKQQDFPGIEVYPDILLDHLTTVDNAFHSDLAFQRAEQNVSGWCAPEVLRSWTQKSLIAGLITPPDAETRFLKSLALAREQGALAWQLRTAISLGQLWRKEGKNGSGITLLDEILSRFTEGFEDANVMTAKALRVELTNG